MPAANEPLLSIKYLHRALIFYCWQWLFI